MRKRALKTDKKNIKTIIKRHIEIIIGVLVGLIIPIGVYGTTILFNSEDVIYDNTTSGLQASTVQDAIDELKVKAQTLSLRVGDYVKVVPDASSYTVPRSDTGYTTVQAPYTEQTTSSVNKSWRSGYYYCCSSSKPTLDSSTGKYTGMTTRTKGDAISGKYCIYLSVSRNSCSSSSSSSGTTIYNPSANASSTSGTSISCTEYSLVGTDTPTDQTITPNELTLWRVININNNGTVEAVSEYVSSTNVYFQGTTGYQKYVATLQTIAAQYAKEGYTVATRMMGYNGQTLTITNTSAFDGSTNSAPSTTTTPSPTTGTGQEYSGGVLGDTLYLKDYLLVQNVYQQDNNTTNYCDTGLCAYKVGTTTKTDYWLASRYYDYRDSTHFGFNVRSIYSGGGLTFYYMRDYYVSRFRDNSYLNALRPIITLKSGLTITGGNGRFLSPYTFS